MSKSKYLKAWQMFLVFVFVYSIYHLLRDILQDILDIHNQFTEFLHYNVDVDALPNYLKWTTFGGWRKWFTFPIEIFMLIAIPQALKKNEFSPLDKIILIIIVLTILFWISIPILT